MHSLIKKIYAPSNSGQIYEVKNIIVINIIIMNIKDWTLWSTVITALANVSLVFQLSSFLVVCSDIISNGFGLVAFFASVKASSVRIRLSCLVCVQSAVHGLRSRLFCGHKWRNLPEVTPFMTTNVKNIVEFNVHGSVHYNRNLIEMTKKMQPCRTIYYSIVP
jgi:hypothetical protein